MADLDVSVTCPHCGRVSIETMPTDRCVAFWECPGCHVIVRPRGTDCCVYCSYGDKRCPFVQDDTTCPGIVIS